jgi:hypothetical protein
MIKYKTIPLNRINGKCKRLNVCVRWSRKRQSIRMWIDVDQFYGIEIDEFGTNAYFSVQKIK